MHRHSYFSPNKYPFESISLSSNTINYEFQRDNSIELSLGAIAHSKRHVVLQATYHVLLADNPADLKAATQCNSVQLATKVVKVAQEETSYVENVAVVFSAGEIAEVTNENEYFFVGAYCFVTIQEAG